MRQLVVDVYIEESRPITTLKVPDIKATNEIDPGQDETGKY